MEIYTREQWSIDRDFKALPGQEITGDIYDQMFNCMPPKHIPQEKALQVWNDYRIPVHAGFLMGEPHSTDKDGNNLYLSFGMNDYGKGQHYYFLGLSKAEPILNGVYYFMESLEAFPNGGLLREKDFKDEREALQTAIDYESTLIKYEYRDGHRVSYKTLYDPI